MRFTILDEAGGFSFLGPAHALKMLAAACSAGVRSGSELLSVLAEYDASLASLVLDGLAVFDEHCVPNAPGGFERWQIDYSLDGPRAFRVVNELSRQASLRSGPLGIVIYNLSARRIVQVQNSYSPLQRHDRGRIRVDGRPTGRIYRYDLPDDWAIVP